VKLFRPLKLLGLAEDTEHHFNDGGVFDQIIRSEHVFPFASTRYCRDSLALGFMLLY